MISYNEEVVSIKYVFFYGNKCLKIEKRILFSASYTCSMENKNVEKKSTLLIIVRRAAFPNKKHENT